MITKHVHIVMRLLFSPSRSWLSSPAGTMTSADFCDGKQLLSKLGVRGYATNTATDLPG
jgi:hypothetical protein